MGDTKDYLESTFPEGVDTSDLETDDYTSDPQPPEDYDGEWYDEFVHSDDKALYLYFKPGGKWKYEGYGANIPIDGSSLTHEKIAQLNGGEMPGISGTGLEYMIVVLDPASYPRFVHARA